MRVLVFTNCWPYSEDPSYGVFVEEQVGSLRRKGIEMDVLFLNGRQSKLNYLKGVLTFLRRHRSNNYDLIHAHHTYCAAISQLQRRRPVVLTLHEGEAFFNISIRERIRQYGFFKVPVFSRYLKRLISRNVSKIITVSSQLAGELGLTRAETLSCGVDLSRFKQMPVAESRRELGLPLEDKIILFPASPDKKGKRFDIVREAVEILSKRVPRLRLVSLGKVPPELVPMYMNASDVLALASDYEASPMVIKEALAVNLPIVSTDVGNVRELIGDTEGCFVSSRSSRDFARHLQEALQYGRNTLGRERILTLGLGLDQVAEKIVNIYRQVLEVGT